MPYRKIKLSFGKTLLALFISICLFGEAGSMFAASMENGDDASLSEDGSQTAYYLEKPVITVTPKNKNKIKISWMPVDGATTYMLSRSTDPEGEFTLISSDIMGNSSEDEEDTQDDAQDEYADGDFSEDDYAGNDNLQDDAAQDEYADGKSSKTDYADKDASEITYVDRGLNGSTTYYYRLYAVSGNMVSEPSDLDSAMTFSFSISKKKVALLQGNSEKIRAHSSNYEKIKWKSMNRRVAKVSPNGKITGVGKGTTKITATSHGVSFAITVNVRLKLCGIDVSHWNHTIKWSKVANSGKVSFAILKATQSTNYKDTAFEKNYKGAKAAGIKVGCYHFTVATSVAKAKREAKYLLRVLKGRKMDYPVALDFEDMNIIYHTNKAQRTQMVLAFKKIVENAGYDFVLYTSKSWLDSYFYNNKFKNMNIWVAQWKVPKCTYTGEGKIAMWQYSSTGKISGIIGRVDMNYCYKSY